MLGLDWPARFIINPLKLNVMSEKISAMVKEQMAMYEKAQKVYDAFKENDNIWGGHKADTIHGTVVSIVNDIGCIVSRDIEKDFDENASVNDIVCTMSMEADFAY
jgi:hypothetical protein